MRDSLLGRPSTRIDDIDIATPARPEPVLAALEAARIKAVPTGLAHGTVTAVFPAAHPPRRFEITTLRRDVETDGRHAVVAFDADWADDAARRDFTINAIYLAPDGASSTRSAAVPICAARHVRFVGDPAPAPRRGRAAPAALLPLRGALRPRRGRRRGPRRLPRGDPAIADPVGRARARELLGLLAAPDPIRALNLMRDDGVLAAILPEAQRIDRLRRLIALRAPDPLLRLAALISADRARRRGLASACACRAPTATASPASPRLLPSTLPATTARSAWRCTASAASAIATSPCCLRPRVTFGEQLRGLRRLAEAWAAPEFPIGGDDVAALGVPQGPRVGSLLAAVRGWWEVGDFTADRDACLARLREVIG